jgi:hypothetical protein
MDTLFDSLPAKVVGLTNARYHAVKNFDSRTTIWAVDQQGGETQYWIDMGHTLFPGNSATSTGSDFDAIVEGIIQGKKFDDLISVPPEDVLGANGSRSTKAYREWKEKQSGIVATEEQRWKFAKMYDSLLRNDASYALINATTETQVSVFFELDGHKLKVRPDACCPDRWWDLKTTSSSWSKVIYSVRDYGYAAQEWLYVQGAMAIGLPHHRMPFVFVQTVPPFGCRVSYLPERLVEMAGRRMLAAMEMMRLRRETGSYFPREANEITEMECPEYLMREEEEVAI